MGSVKKDQKKIKLWDKLGVLISSLCIVHCILLPAVILAFPTITSLLGLNEDKTHISLLLFLLPATLFAVYSGFRVHGQKKPIVFLILGLLFVLFGTLAIHDLLGHHWEPVFVIIGSILLVRGHLLNSHHCKRCEEEHHCIWEHGEENNVHGSHHHDS